MIAAIVGAGDLGAALAYTLSTRDRLREIRLIDEGGTIAEGKALDILQSAPIHGSSARVLGTRSLEAVRDSTVVAVADPLEPPGGGPGMRREIVGDAGLGLLQRIATVTPRAPIVCAGAGQAWMVERAVSELGLDPRRVLGSAPDALHAGACVLIGLECGASPDEVQIALAGLPPRALLFGWESASLNAAPLNARLPPHTRRRLESAISALWPPGPVSLAHSAARTIEKLAFGSDRSQHAFAVLDGDRSRARVTVAYVRFGRGRVLDVTLPALSGREQLALDTLLRSGPP